MSLSGLLEIWGFIQWFPKFILRRIFTKKRMPDLVLIDAVAREGAFEVNLAEHPRYSIYLQLVNLAPCPVILDRAKMAVSLPGMSTDHLHIMTVELAPSEVRSILIQGEISEGKANTVARLLPHERDKSGSLSIDAEFRSELHDFKKEHFFVDRLHVTYVNEQWHLKPEQ